MLSQLTLEQLQEWEAYNAIDPIGEWREDYRIAKLESMVMNIALSVWGKEGSTLTSPKDFMPEFYQDQEEVKRKHLQQIKEMFLGLSEEGG